MPEIIDKLRELNEKLTERVVVDPAMLEQLVDQLPDGLLVINEQGLIQLCNEQIELMFGYPRSLLLGEPIHMLLPEALRERHIGHIARYFSNPTIRPMHLAQTLAGQHRTGRTVHVQIILGPLVSTQGVLALAVIRRVDPNGPGK
jgi:PAS domain S-box-containing protein